MEYGKYSGENIPNDDDETEELTLEYFLEQGMTMEEAVKALEQKQAELDQIAKEYEEFEKLLKD